MISLKSAKNFSKRLSRQYGVINPPDVIPLKYSRTGKCAILGYYDNHNNTIEINKYALELWKSKDIQDVIRHELIHTLCYQEFGHGGHGSHFKELCDKLGIEGDARYAVRKVR